MPTLFQFPSGSALTIVDSDVFYFGQNGTEYRLPFSVIKEAFGNVQQASLSIPTASVLTLNATPLTIVAAPGAGYAIELINVSLKMTYNSVAYATNTTVQLIASGASAYQAQFNSAVLASASSTWNTIAKSALSGTNVIENTALQVKVPTGNPTAGNSDIKVFCLYRIIEI